MEKTAWLGALLAAVAVVLDPVLQTQHPALPWVMACHAFGVLLAVAAALIARSAGPVTLRVVLLLALVNLMLAVMDGSVLFLQNTAQPLPGLLVFYYFCLLPLASLTTPAMLVALDGVLLIQTLVLLALAEATGLGPVPYLATLQFLVPGQILFSLFVVWTREQALEAYLLARDDHVHLTLDSLSEVLNRATWLRRAESRLGRDLDAGRPSVLLMADIDHFKAVNDSWGHPAGDEVIRTVARVLVETTRGDDLVGRFGGEEFAVFLPDTDLVTGLQVAERIRSRVEAQNLFCPVTLSLGVAVGGSGADGLADLILEADRQLYSAKRGGRNRVRPGP